MKFDVCIIGLGYVGLTLAAAFASKGIRVLGVEKRADVVEKTNMGIPHFQEKGLDKVLKKIVKDGYLVARKKIPPQSEIAGKFIITVGTPLNDKGAVNLNFIEQAVNEILDHVDDDALIILRSTVKVGVCKDIVIPILSKTEKIFHVAMCPERTLEGKALEELNRLPQIIGSDDPVAIRKAEELFSLLTNSIVKMSSYEAAEITKLVDNTYRDVRFAFANEVARICEAYNVNALEVINGGKLGYERTNVALPGLVGGPCLEKDPHIFLASAHSKGIDLEISKSARLVNERQPSETVNFIVKEAIRRRMRDDISIALLGMAFKGIPETDDLRGAMSKRVLGYLKQHFPKAQIRLYDPVICKDTLESHFENTDCYSDMKTVLTGADIVVITNNHPQLSSLEPIIMLDLMKPGAFIYDYWNHFLHGAVREKQNNYFGVGNIQ